MHISKIIIKRKYIYVILHIKGLDCATIKIRGRKDKLENRK